MIRNSRLVIRLALRYHHDVVEKIVGVGVGGDKNVGGDDVSGMQLAENAGVFQLVGHGHRFHKAGNCLMIERDFALGGVG